MSRTKKVLLIVAMFELLAIIGLLVWLAFFQSSSVSAPANHTAKESTPYKKPVIAVREFATGLKAPVDITAPRNSTDERLFVVEQAGAIRTIGKDGKLNQVPFLDITSKVTFDNEMGLLGLAFDPKYAENGFIYVNYVDKGQNTIIARFTSTPQTGVADLASEKVILTLKQPYANHNGGSVKFGPDGYLYIALGDGGSAGDPENRAQNKNELLGKLLRLDVNTEQPYAIPTTNPFVGQTGVKTEIWATGLRNPWRISFDSKKGDLFIADVGQGDIEEVNMQLSSSKGGENYGWRCYEGNDEFKLDGCGPKNNFVFPSVIAYDHTEERCSVTGGYVYRGKAEPALDGSYFYGDFCSGHIYYAKQGKASQSPWKSELGLKTNYKISTFGEDKNGELYVADLGNGTVYRLEDTAN